MTKQLNPDPEKDETATEETEHKPGDAAGENQTDPAFESSFATLLEDNEFKPLVNLKEEVKKEAEKFPGSSLVVIARAVLYRSKFSESTREGVRLNSELEEERKLRTAAEAKAAEGETHATELALEAELRAEHPDWDVMAAEEQKLARENLVLKKQDQRNQSELSRYRKQEKFDRDFATLITKPEFKTLATDKEEINKRVLDQPSTPLETIARAYLHEKSQLAVDANETSRPGLEAPTSPQIVTQPKGEYTGEQLEAMRKTNPKQYNRIMKARMEQKHRK